MLERMSASPGMARATAEAAFRMDVRPILPTITAPTLVIHAREDPIPVQGGRYVADHIPGARLLEVDGADHAPWFTDPDTIMTGIEDFLTGSHAAPSQSHRALRTVLFTDMVASTQYATARRLWPLRRHPFVDDLAHRPLAAGDVGSNSYRGLRGRQVVAGILLCREPHPRLFPLTGIRTDPRVDRNLVAHNRSAAGAVGHRDLADLRRQLLSSTHFADAFSRGEQPVAAALLDVAGRGAFGYAKHLVDHLHRSTPVDVPTIEVGHLLQALRRNSWTAAAGLADTAPRALGVSAVCWCRRRLGETAIRLLVCGAERDSLLDQAVDMHSPKVRRAYLWPVGMRKQLKLSAHWNTLAHFDSQRYRRSRAVAA